MLRKDENRMQDKITEPKQQRMHYLDLLKGIGIILVVLGHNSFHDYATQAIYLFHMPLFFVMSGFLDKLDGVSFGDYFRKKMKRLMYPYITFGVLIILYNTLFDALSGNRSPVKLMKRIAALAYGNLIWENNSEYIGTLWFLAGLFCSGMIAYAIYRASGKSRIKLFIFGAVSMLAGAGMAVIKNKYPERLPAVRLPWCLDVALIGGLFFLAGYYWRRKWQDKVNRLSQGVLFLGAGFLLGAANLAYMKLCGYEMLRVDMLQMNYGIVPLYFTGALFISLGFMIILKNIYHGGVYWLEKIGQLSMLIMIDHIYIQQIVVRILMHFGMNFWIISFPVTLVISVILAIALDKYFSFLANYEKLKLIMKNSRERKV